MDESCDLEARERVKNEDVTATAGTDDELAAAGVVEVLVLVVEERRARLFERVVGPDEEEEGADEVASARFRLRVSIQNPKPPAKSRIHLAD